MKPCSVCGGVVFGGKTPSKLVCLKCDPIPENEITVGPGIATPTGLVTAATIRRHMRATIAASAAEEAREQLGPGWEYIFDAGEPILIDTCSSAEVELTKKASDIPPEITMRPGDPDWFDWPVRPILPASPPEILTTATSKDDVASNQLRRAERKRGRPRKNPDPVLTV